MTDRFPREINLNPVTSPAYRPLRWSASMTVLEEFNEAARLFTGPVFILLPNYYRHPKMPHLHIDLSRIGLVRGGQYQVYQEGNQFLYANDQRYFGASPRDQRLVAASPHGTRLFVQCFDGQILNRALIWICKRQDFPILTSSLYFRKSPEDRLQTSQAEQTVTAARPRDRIRLTTKLNEVRLIQGRVSAGSSSRVSLVIEPMLQPIIALTSQGRSQVVAAGATVNFGLLSLPPGRSSAQGQGCTLVVGQLRTRQGEPSKLESHFRVRPRDPSTPEQDYTYGAFGRALIKHRDRYWFTFDPALSAIPRPPKV